MENAEKKLEFGTVEYRGQELTLTQQPYLEMDHYEAVAIDNADEEYVVKWSIKSCYIADEFMLPDDESEACHWGVYTVTRI